MSATEELLGTLHDAVASQLLEKVLSGTATPAELSTAVKFLKDNGIEALPSKSDHLTQLADQFPEFSEDAGPLHVRN